MPRFRLRKSSLKTIFILVAGFVLPFEVGFAQDASSSVPISCRVVDDIDHRPVARARLTLSGGGLSQPIAGFTDAQGACPSVSVPRGQYTLAIEKAGYFPHRSQEGDGTQAFVFETQGGAQVELGDIVLIKMRSISGFVSWQDGEPAEHVIVHALYVTRGLAAFRPALARQVLTNGKGEFRLESLRPGRYVVYAYVLGLAQGNAKPRIALPVFYPASSMPEVANGVDVRVTPEVSNLGLKLQDTAGVMVAGKVSPTRRVTEGDEVHIGLLIPGNPGQAFAGTLAHAGERFALYDVPPGEYLLYTAALARKVWTFQRVHVGNQPIEDVQVLIDEVKPIDGRVQIKGAAAKPADGRPADPAQCGSMTSLANIRISAESRTLPLFPLRGTTEANGSFHLDLPAPGESYSLSLVPPHNTYLLSVTQANRDVTNGTIAADGGPVSVLLQCDGARVQGRVTDDEGHVRGGFVVLAPKDRKAEHRFRTSGVARDGAYALAGIAPGEYDLFALSSNEEDAYYDPGYLKVFEDRAVPVTVAPGGSAEVSLKLLPVRHSGR